MIAAGRNTAELEYAVMLTVLDFQTQFMKSNYRRAQVHVLKDTIEVRLSKTGLVPAEDRLARTPEGRALLEEVHAELFRAGEGLLRELLERALGLKILSLSSRLDASAGTTVIVIILADQSS
jgi:uncharacterized protein YbcI